MMLIRGSDSFAYVVYSPVLLTLSKLCFVSMITVPCTMHCELSHIERVSVSKNLVFIVLCSSRVAHDQCGVSTCAYKSPEMLYMISSSETFAVHTASFYLPPLQCCLLPIKASDQGFSDFLFITPTLKSTQEIMSYGGQVSPASSKSN